jgi:hypothetical protein
VHVLNGCFLDRGVWFGLLGAFDLQKGEAYLRGDGNEKMDFTTYADTAAYTTDAAVDDPLPDEFCVAGESLTFHALANETAVGLGRPITVKELGTLAALDAAIAHRFQAEHGNMFSWLLLMYWRPC